MQITKLGLAYTDRPEFMNYHRQMAIERVCERGLPRADFELMVSHIVAQWLCAIPGRNGKCHPYPADSWEEVEDFIAKNKTLIERTVNEICDMIDSYNKGVSG
jgi:hypothetical protein